MTLVMPMAEPGLRPSRAVPGRQRLSLITEEVARAGEAEDGEEDMDAVDGWMPRPLNLFIFRLSIACSCPHSRSCRLFCPLVWLPVYLFVFGLRSSIPILNPNPIPAAIPPACKHSAAN